MVISPPAAPASTLVSVSNAIVKIHKELLGRGPTQARAELAGPDALLCVLERAPVGARQA
jgi:hypothetical protein